MNNFRTKIATHIHSCTSITRNEIFGVHDRKYRPINLIEDANTMFAGYVGENYILNGVVIFGVNPGGGGDAYKRRSLEDENFYPLLYDLKFADSEDVVATFEAANNAFVPIVKKWKLWKIFEPTLKALRQNLSDIATAAARVSSDHIQAGALQEEDDCERFSHHATVGCIRRLFHSGSVGRRR